MDLRRLGTIAGVRGTAVARARRRLRPVDDGPVLIVPTRFMLGEVIATVAVAPSARGDVVLGGDEKAREVETLQARRLAEVDCEGSVAHVSFSASCSAPLSPQQWPLGLAASLPEDVRVKFEDSSVEIEAKASVDPYSEVLSQGLQRRCFQRILFRRQPIAATSTGSVFRDAKVLSPLSVQTPYAAVVQVSKSQGEQNAVAPVARVSACYGWPSGAGL